MKEKYSIDELMKHFRFVQQQAISLGALFTEEEIDKSWAIYNKLQNSDG